MTPPLCFIGVASGAGAGDPGCADGPRQLRIAGTLDDLGQPPRAKWTGVAPPVRLAANRPLAVAQVATTLARRVRKALQAGALPVVVGGDHSIALGTWAGVRAALPSNERLGLLWFDAHLDSHTFATTPSQNIHGMPLACLLGHGDPLLTRIGGRIPKVQPEDVCIVGARSFESEEKHLLEALGVRIYGMAEIHARGLSAVVSEAIGQVTRHTAGFGISFDVDVLDPREEAGTGTPVADGLFRDEVLTALTPWRGDGRLLALEIVEFNPHRDEGHATARAIHDLCRTLVGPPDPAKGGPG